MKPVNFFEGIKFKAEEPDARRFGRSLGFKAQDEPIRKPQRKNTKRLVEVGKHESESVDVKVPRLSQSVSCQANMLATYLSSHLST
ncbi:MAG: hypothetical protein RMJ54_13530 [Roseiflexaceae bacterium]|nr:hypothetical protein [Roseiflexaceae bacterium]